MLNNLDYNILENLNDSNENNKLINVLNGGELDSTLLIEDKFDPINEGDLNNIVAMGYNPKMAKKVYILLKPHDINEAIDFLTEEDGIYQHDFMERHGRKDECFICGSSAKYHINYDKESKSLLDQIRDSLSDSRNRIRNDLIDVYNNDDKLFNEDKNSNKKEEKGVFCDLCFEELLEQEIKDNALLCKHTFCNDCYLNYFQDKIKNNKVGKITCMQHKCNIEFSEEFIISHLNGDQNLIKKYKKFKLRADLYNDPNIKFCPIKDCESYARKEGNNKYVTCQEGHKFCFECFKPWHGKKKCQDEIDKDFKKWKKNKVIKRCPKCKMWTEKNLGCNHMTCAECKYQWCWLCEGEYTQGHFEVGGPCAGLQFSQCSIVNCCCCFYLYKLWILFYQLLMFIFIIPIYGFIKTLKYYDESYDYNCDNSCGCFIHFFIWICWCISYLGFFIPIGIVSFIFSLFLCSCRDSILQWVFDYY